jgi:hypothetical protein
MSKADMNTLSERPEVVRYADVLTRNYMIEDICRALRTAGYTSLDRQAKALGLHRSTAWTIVKNKHKVGRLSKKTVTRIMENPETPHAVRVVVQRYLAGPASSR